MAKATNVASKAAPAIAQDAAAKRKLSDSASTREDAKRARMEEQERKNAEVQAKREREREEAEKKQQELFKSQGIDTENYQIDSSGPHTFYCWADAIESLFDSEMEDENPLFYHKQSALDAFKPVAALPKDDREEAMDDYLDAVSTWHVSVDEGACQTPEAKRLKALWRRAKREARDQAKKDAPRKAEEAGKADEKVCGAEKTSTEGGKDEDQDGGNDGWWYEVYAQREKPEESKAAMEVTLGGSGELWLTGFKAAESGGRRAMSFMCNFFMDY